MKTITNDYRTNIKEFGKEIDSKITYTENGNVVELGVEELNSITPHFEGGILKSVMKQLDIDSSVEIPIGTVVNYQFGVLVDDEPVTYEYVDFGNYVVKEIEKQEDLNSYKITCYDKMLYSMVDYEALNITYPITVRDYINAICTHLGLTFKNASDTFANYNRQIPSERYLDSDGNSLNYTFRDVFDELAQVTASTICINEEDDELEIRYVNKINLPSAYTQVDYIESSGTQYIDTGVKPTTTTDIEVEFTKGNGYIGWQKIFGQDPSAPNKRFQLEMNNQNLTSWYIEIAQNQRAFTADANNWVKFKFVSGTGAYVNGSLVNSFSTTETNNYNIWLFRGYDRYSKIKMKYAKLYQNNNLVRYLVPCIRNNDNVVGMYDIVNNAFYTNQGTGVFTYGNVVSETIDEENLKDINVNFNQKYGPVNSIVLSRADGTDNVYTQDQQSIAQNGLCEIKIEDNQIMNGDDREDYLPDLLTQLDGLEYYINDFSSTGITYLELCDKYNVSITKEDDEGNTTTVIYPCVLLNDEVNVTQGLEEIIHTDMPDEGVTDYQYASYTDKSLKKAFIKVDKQNARIELEVSQKLDEDEFTGANIILEINNDQSIAEINADKISLAGKEIDLTSQNITITSDNFQVDSEGNMTCKDGTFTGGNITLQDDGSEENASLKVQTITTSTKSYTLSDDLSDEWIKIVASKTDTFPDPSTFAHDFIGTGSKYSTLIQSANYKLIFAGVKTTPDLSGNYRKLYNMQLRDSNFDMVGDKVIWSCTQEFDSTDTMTGATERRNYEEYQLPADFGQLTAINPDNIVLVPSALNNYFTLIEYTNREFSYSGYGITSDIFLSEAYTMADLTRVNGIIAETIIPTSDDYEKYDFTGDGVINLTDKGYVWVLATGYTYDDTDLQRINDILMGTITPISSDYDKYDIDGDGDIDSLDYISVYKIVNEVQPAINNTTTFEINTKRLQNNIAFTQNGDIKTAMDVNGFYQNGVNIYDRMYEQNILWSGGLFMSDTHTIQLDQNISDQKTGVILVWSAYDSGGVENWWWNTTFVPKELVKAISPAGVTCIMSGGGFSAVGSKYVYVSDNSITGHSLNGQTGTTNGISWKNNLFVLRYVIGV